MTDGEAKEWLHEVAVVEHGAIDDALVILGVLLEVLVMGGDDAERAVPVEALEQRLGQCAANEWLCAATELVDEQQCALVAVTDEVLHVRQV